MEEMLQEVYCLRSGQFYQENLITIRVAQDTTSVFTDEQEMKKKS